MYFLKHAYWLKLNYLIVLRAQTTVFSMHAALNQDRRSLIVHIFICSFLNNIQFVCLLSIQVLIGVHSVCPEPHVNRRFMDLTHLTLTSLLYITLIAVSPGL